MPLLLAAVADDADHADAEFSAGDTITLHLDRATNRGGGKPDDLTIYGFQARWMPLEGGKDFVDTLLSFDHPMGDDYSGAWLDASTFVFTALDTEAARPPMVGQTTVRFNPDFTWDSEAAVVHNVTNVAGTSAGSTNAVTLGGSFGSTRPPRLVSVTVADADNGDEALHLALTLALALALSLTVPVTVTVILTLTRRTATATRSPSPSTWRPTWRPTRPSACTTSSTSATRRSYG